MFSVVAVASVLTVGPPAATLPPFELCSSPEFIRVYPPTSSLPSPFLFFPKGPLLFFHFFFFFFYIYYFLLFFPFHNFFFSFFFFFFFFILNSFPRAGPFRFPILFSTTHLFSYLSFPSVCSLARLVTGNEHSCALSFLNLWSENPSSPPPPPPPFVKFGLSPYLLLPYSNLSPPSLFRHRETVLNVPPLAPPFLFFPSPSPPSFSLVPQALSPSIFCRQNVRTEIVSKPLHFFSQQPPQSPVLPK